MSIEYALVSMCAGALVLVFRAIAMIQSYTAEPIWLRMYTYAHTPPGVHADDSCAAMDSYLWHVYVTK